ncbi:MAG TPA: amidase [Candidatus Binataceae bacterium]|jgi:Asp-tRNA(Asn)/Glu-tRNA(Gln) amidotransferase A subunit family amidase|nr:amidase [Candidatus Binataceae bacterium]
MLNPYIEAVELRELVLRREVRPREVAEFFLARIERLNPRLGAYMTVAAERALADAERLEELSPAEAAAMPLFGVAYSLKDLTWTRDIRTTLGSRNFENFRPRADAELAVRLRNAGGILLGKTTTPELGGRPTTEGGLCPPARNPWNLEHSAGGSSGGAAAQVAAGMGPLAEGTDGGGSIRVPAACSGVVGLKPSRGRVSFAPVMGEGWAGLATEGPIARSVRDAALMLDVMAGPVVGDPYWAPPPPRPFVSAVADRPKGLHLAMIAGSALGPVDPEVTVALEHAADVFRAMGHRVEPVHIDPAQRLIEYTRLAISAGLASVPIKNPDLMDPVVRRAWEFGRRLSATDYVGALARMHNTAREIVQALAPYDATLAPTLPHPAPRLGMPTDKFEDELYPFIQFTFPYNATGQPAFSLPNGFSRAGLPIGLQIIGRQADELGIIALAAQFEEARPWRDLRPPLD